MTKMPKDPARRWEWIKYQLRLRGNSTAQLARQIGVHDRALRNAKTSPYPRIERAIAAALGLKPVDIWPERWNADGTPHRQRPNRAESTKQYHCTDAGKDSGCYPVAHRKTDTEN